MVPANILQRVLRLRWNDSTGAGFTLEQGAKQFLFTASHVVEGMCSGDTFEYLIHNEFHSCRAGDVWHLDSDIDIAVIELLSDLTPRLPVLRGLKGSYLGQQAYFLGFPLGLRVDASSVNGGRPIPLMKAGIVAGFRVQHAADIYLDGHNNPGFSGGPIITLNNGVHGVNTVTVIGVVSSAPYFDAPVLYGAESGGDTTGLSVEMELGFVRGFGLEHSYGFIDRS